MDPRVRRTRQLIEDAFRGLVTEKRFAAISVQDIAERATVNRATFYAHYVDKQDLAASVLRADLRNAVLTLFDSRPAVTHENLVAMAVAVFEFLARSYDACPETALELQGIFGTALQEELYEMMEHWLSLSNAHLRLFPGCSKATVATVISWSIYGGAHRWSRARDRKPAATVCREIISVLLPPAK